MLDSRKARYNRIDGKRAILTGLRASSRVSQADLASRVGLTPSAVSQIVGQMIRDKWIVNIGQGKTTAAGGRPPTYLALNADARFTLGIYVSTLRVDIAKVNLAFDVQPIKSIPKPAAMPAEDVLELLVREFKEFASGVNMSDCDGLSVMLGGPVDHTAGTISDSNHVKCGPDGFPLWQLLREQVKVPVVIDSEVSASLSAEMWSGAGLKHHDVAYIYYDNRGSVIGFCLNGRLYRGKAGPAGQIYGYFFDHTPIEGKAYEYHDGRFLPSVWLSDEEKREVTAETFLDLNAFARGDGGNDPKVRRLLAKRLDLLARGMINICNLICPEVIILGGRLVELEDSSVEFIQKRLVEDAIRKVHVNHARIVKGELPFSKAVFIGGASYLLNKWFERSL